MPANLENSAVAIGLEKFIFIPIPIKGNSKECSNYCTIALISHARRVMLKILQARFQQYMNSEIPDVQPGFRKGRRTRDQWQHSLDEKKQENPPKISTSASLTMLRSLTHNKLWKTLKEMGTPAT